jgi:uncharacterized protein YbaR (Trm112 family)
MECGQSPADTVEGTSMPLDSGLLAILACPVCRAPLRDQTDEPDRPELVCTGCGRAYPVRDGIPVLLVSEARAPEPQPPPTIPSASQPPRSDPSEPMPG